MPRRPNIVFILIDDMGWRDVSCYGSTFYETPVIDQLARDGMRFTDAYAACPVCSPTRASLLTGKYPATVGITDWIDSSGNYHPCRGRLIDVPYLKALPRGENTLARALQEEGYATWHVGKWHLGDVGSHPEDHGFEVNVGGCKHGHPYKGYFSPYHIPTLSDGPDGEYLTDRLTDEAIGLIERHVNDAGDNPFFLNLWHYTVHTPLQAPAELIEKYRRKAAALGLDREQAIIEGEPFPFERKKYQRVGRRVIQSDPTYAAMVENLDSNIGRLLAALDRLAQADNTIVIFTSDNGGLATAEGSPTSNLPLAEGKGWMYEGGTREPLIVRWPGHVPAGSVCRSTVTSPDFYPTLLQAAGLSPRPQQHVDGQSFLPALRGEQYERGPIFWHYPHYGNQGGTPGSSVRHGRWKLIEFFEDGRLELYDVVNDVGEKQECSAENPQITRRLHHELLAWRARVEAKIPQVNTAWSAG